VPFTTNAAGEQYLDELPVCWDGVYDLTQSHYRIYNHSDMVVWITGSVRSVQNTHDSELFRWSLGIDPTGTYVMPDEYAQAYRIDKWTVDYGISVAWLAQSEILARIEDARPKAYIRIFSAGSPQRHAIAACVKAAWDMGSAASQSGDYLTARELFTRGVGLADSTSECGKAWRELNKEEKIKFPSIKKGLVANGKGNRYAPAIDEWLRSLRSLLSAVK
jgi:hypothetical protein